MSMSKNGKMLPESKVRQILADDAIRAEVFARRKAVTKLRKALALAWDAACIAEGIPVNSKFVVFGKTPEAAAYNKLALKFFNESRLENYAEETLAGTL